MKTLYKGTYVIDTNSLRATRTFYFASLEDRLKFESAAKEKFSAERRGTNIEHVMTPREALAELEHEKALYDAI